MAPDLTLMTFQTTGIVLVALVLRLLSAGVAGRFMVYWSTGWFALAVAVASLQLSHFLSAHDADSPLGRWRSPVLTVFCLLEYAFGFLLWAGCRQYTSGIGLGRADRWRMAVPMTIAVVGPALLASRFAFLPFHAALCGFFFLMALLALIPARPRGLLAAIGLRLMQTALAGLILVFWWHALALPEKAVPESDWYSLHFSAVFNGLVVTLLGFGCVIVASDFNRRELEERNRRLADLSDQLAIAARTDPLTGLLNRRAFDAMLMERQATPFYGSVAVLDMNDLKTLNDRYGHKAGDAAIQLVARALRTHFRITDPIFRMGGDEFLIVLEGGRAGELASRLESVERALSGIRLPGVTGATNLGVAWGMADFEQAADVPSAVERADAEMYRSKAAKKRIPTPG